MRILFASHHASRIAGAETYVHTVASALRGRGHDVAVLPERPAVLGREPIDEAGVLSPVAECTEPRALEEVRRFRPDVVYVQGLRSVALERRLMSVAPPVLFEHSYAGLCVSGSRTWQSAGRACDRPLGPGCLAHYFPHRCGGRSAVTMVREYARQRARQRLHSRYRAIIVASRYVAGLFAGSGCAERVHVLAPPVPAPPSESVRELRTEPRVVYLGRLEALKGVHLLLESVAVAAACLRRSLELCIAGDGPLHPLLEDQSRRSLARGVRMALQGWRTLSQRDALLASADLLVMPSVWPEPFGLAGLEAARFGVPSVAFASGGVPEWLCDGVNGLIAAEQNAESLGRSIAAALGDDNTYRRLSRGALHAAHSASPDGHAAELERVFGEIVR